MAFLLVQVWLFVAAHILSRTLSRIATVCRSKTVRLLIAPAITGIAISYISRAHASNTQAYEPAYTSTPELDKAVDQVFGWFYFDLWVRRGMQVRNDADTHQCLLNLAKALDEVEVISAAEYNGAAGALALLPTVGALLGAPTREMWIVYKLVPIAGILTMFLSLGATITPSDVGEYESGKAFSYGGLMPTVRTEAAPTTHDDVSDVESFEQMTEAKKFARIVKLRAADDSGGDVQHIKVWAGIGFQCLFIAILLIALWYAQRGAVVPWWCRVWGWMYFWYFLVAITSLFDNIVAAPFSQSWTIRVARGPNNVRYDGTQSKLVPFTGDSRFPTIIDRLKAGINLRHHLTIAANEPSAYSRTCFYVVVSVQGINSWHALMQLVSRISSVAMFAFGTALFASATLMSISAALMLLCLVLPTAMMGRVVAMWIAAEMNKTNKSIIHTVVKSKKEAGEHLEAIIELEGLQVETMGHIILDGNVITRHHPLFSAATYLGLLAKPYDLLRVALKNQRRESFRDHLMSPKTAAMSTMELTQVPSAGMGSPMMPHSQSYNFGQRPEPRQTMSGMSDSSRRKPLNPSVPYSNSR